MLRITVHDKPRALTFQLEGRLAGAWLRELEECWLNALACPHKPVLRVDLTGVTWINAAAKACLAAFHRQGAEFIAADCVTKAVVAEITQRTGIRDQGSGKKRSAVKQRDRRAQTPNPQSLIPNP